MLSRNLPRFLLQAGLLIGVAAIAAVLHLDAWAIVVVMAAAFGGVVLAEWLMTRDGGARAAPARAASVTEPLPEAVPEAQPLAAPPPPRPRTKGTSLLRPPRADAPTSRPVVVPPPVRPPAPPPAQEPARPRPRPQPAPAASSPPVTPAPIPPAPPSPRPEPARAPAPPPAAPRPAPLPEAPVPTRAPPPPAPEPTRAGQAPPEAPAPPPPPPIAPPLVERRRWNVFDLQNRARSIAGTDPARDEEFTFLLLYLREFADVSGELSEDFDGFVRESFPELISSA